MRRTALLALCFAASAAAQPCPPQWTVDFAGSGLERGDVHDLAVVGEPPFPFLVPAGLYVVGQFARCGGVPANSLARFDGTQWHAIGSGLTYDNGDPGVVHAVVSWTSPSGIPELFVAGEFTRAVGVEVNNIAKWNGFSWSRVGSAGAISSDSPISDMKVLDIDGPGPTPPAVYISGLLRIGTDFITFAMARWNGSSWSGVGPVFPFGYASCFELFDPDGPGPAAPALHAGGVLALKYPNSFFRLDGATWIPIGDLQTPVTELALFDEDGDGAVTSSDISVFLTAWLDAVQNGC